jgi:transposase
LVRDLIGALVSTVRVLSAVPAGGAIPPVERRRAGSSMPSEAQVVIGGVDTHKDVHVAAVIDERGKILDTASFSATAKGYRELLTWLGSFGKLAKVGVEGTGAYGAGLARHLGKEGVEVVEVNRPNRQARRRRGKSDTVDAEAAARAALNWFTLASLETPDLGFLVRWWCCLVQRRPARTPPDSGLRDSRESGSRSTT